jgi:hypothetical protein
LLNKKTCRKKGRFSPQFLWQPGCHNAFAP